MIIHKKYVVPEYFDYIKNNQKTCYINLNIGSFSEMKKGDIIIKLNEFIKKNDT